MIRDRAAEREYLAECLDARPVEPSDWERVSELALHKLFGQDEFIDAVQARLDEHGPDVSPRTGAQIMHEALEEAADLCAWICLALSACPEEERPALLKRLAPAVVSAEQAWAAIRRAQYAEGVA